MLRQTCPHRFMQQQGPGKRTGLVPDSPTMTSLSLLFWIALGIVLQLAIYLTIGFVRHWQNYLALRDGTLAVAVSPSPTFVAATTQPVVAAWNGYRKFRVDRRVIEDANQSICSFHLVPEDGLPLPSFLPGQYLTFRLEVPAPDGSTEQIVRCYSLSDAPRPDCYRVSIKRVPAPAGSDFPPGRSSNYFHDHVGVGSVLELRAPGGHFHIDDGNDPVVLIGSGIGITPMLSMANWSLAHQPGREVWLFYGVRNSRELIMKSHLATLAAAHPNFQLRVCFSDPLPEDLPVHDYQHRVRISVNVLRMHLPLKPLHFYICGPTPMMQELVPALDDWGVADARIHFEAFGPASIKRNRPIPAPVANRNDTTEDNIAVTFAKSGKTIQWRADAGSLLDFAEANGIAVNSGCRAGGCGSCQTTIQSGQVGYQQSPDFDPEPGTCLLCVCKPTSSVTLEA
jgi:ferredoxin-NADP reductase